ncbi:hypothetical protein [Arthrobacter cupressi]|nr:hypothetical protein [Arthrobacter cupressi]NYD78394.1 hypothetical protein [Arthrobacter cupressi]
MRDFDVLMSPDDGLAGGKLGVTIGGTAIERISRTYIALFNRKGDSVSGSDIVASDKLRIGVNDGDTILQARILAVSRPQCGFNLALVPPEASMVEVTFDFMDAQDGAILEVLHQGDTTASVGGTIRGATFRDRGKGDLTPSAIRTIAAKSLVARFNHYSKKKGQNRFTFSLLLLLPFVMLVLTIFQVWASYSNHASGPIGIEGFDFKTLEGQESFLAAASAAGLHPRGAGDILMVMLILLGMLVVLAFFMYRALVVDRIPKTITSHIVEAESEND